MAPFVTDASRFALAFGGNVNETEPFVVRTSTSSAPSAVSSRSTLPLVDLAVTPPDSASPRTPPFVVIAAVLPDRAVRRMRPLVVVARTTAFFGTRTW